MTFRNTLTTSIAIALLACTGSVLAADDHVYTEGPVVNVSKIRTMDGHFDDYMNWLSTVWKAQNEAAKKMGDVLSYAIYTVEARSPQDPDLLLVVTYKNWAALDGALAKNDAISKMTEGSLAAANKSFAERGKIRTVLGSETMQELTLK